MAQRTFNRPLPNLAAGSQFNLFDEVLGGFGSLVSPGRSSGTQLITPVAQQEFPSDVSILGYGFTFQGLLFNIQNTVNSVPQPCYATLPKLYGGLLKNTGAGVGSGPLTGLPTDRTMVDLLWDGTADEPWPQALDAVPNLSAQSMQSYKVSLPQPVDIQSDDTLSVGLWLTSMVGQNVGIWILQAAYSILYDDPNR